MKKNLILLTVSFVMFMEALDTTIINTAIPNMATSLDVNPIDLKLALISYLLTLAIFIPVSGWLAEKYGIKKVFIIAISIFTLSSIWCGLTDSLFGLILARLVQGIGGSMTVPVGRLIVLRTCKRDELISNMNIVIMVAALGFMVGPMVGGFITEHLSWRWIFFVNVPVGVITVFMSLKILPKFPTAIVPPLDKIGFILFGTGLALLTFSLSTFSESEISHSLSLIILGTSILLLTLYILHSYNKNHPIVEIALFKDRTFRISVASNLISRTGFGGIPFLVPLLLQIVLGYSPQLSGLLLAPTALGVVLSKPLSLYVLRFLGYKRSLILNTVLISLCLYAFGLINYNTPKSFIVLMTFCYGFLISLQYTAMNSLAYVNISQQQSAAATSIMSTTQQLAQSFGVAIAAIFLRYYTEGSLFDFHTFHQTFLTLGLCTLLSIPIFIPLKKDDGHEMIFKQVTD